MRGSGTYWRMGKSSEEKMRASEYLGKREEFRDSNLQSKFLSELCYMEEFVDNIQYQIQIERFGNYYI